MSKEQKEKKCRCASPLVTQALPEGFTGIIRCKNCEGLASVSRNKKSYDGNDPVEKYLHGLSEHNVEYGFEAAVIAMLLRIEKAVTPKANEEESKRAK